MRRSRDGLIWGLVFLVVGIGFLIWNFGLLEDVTAAAELAVAALFALVGLGFLVAYLMSRQDWWRLIPGFLLLSVGAIVALGTRNVPAEWLAGILLAGLSLAFAVIYFTDRQERWWALIPFGTMAVMVTTILASTLQLDQGFLGLVLFGGMGLVFLLLYLFAPDRRPLRWALIPAAVLFVMSLVSLAAGLNATWPDLAGVLRLWPIVLVVVGVSLIAVAFARPLKPPDQQTPSTVVGEVPTTPGTSVIDLDGGTTAGRHPPSEAAPVTLVEQLPPADGDLDRGQTADPAQQPGEKAAE